MNKSKFLKRSLAAILAILMVVAMVPSALAVQVVNESVPTARVFANPGYSIWVDNKEAQWDEDNNAYTATKEFPEGDPAPTKFDVSMIQNVANTTVTVKEIDNGKLSNSNIEVKADKADKKVDAFGAGTYTYTLVAEKTDADGVVVETNEYKLVITVTMKVKSADATIKAIKTAKMKASSSTAIKAVRGTFDNDKGTIDIVLALGQAKPTDIIDEETVFIPSSSDTGVAVDYTSGTTDKITVTAANGSKKIYNINYTWESAFDTFKLGDFEGKIDTKTSDTTAKTITIDLPYSYTDSGAVSTAEANKLISSWTSDNEVKINGDVATSGEKELAFSSTTGSWTDPATGLAYWTNTLSGYVTVQTKKSGAHVAMDVVIRSPKLNPSAELTGIKVGDSQYIPITGTTKDVTLPAGVDIDTNKIVTVWGSKNAEIELAKDQTTGTPADQKFGASGPETIDDTDKGEFSATSNTALKVNAPLVFKVTSEDTKTTNFYTVNINKSTTSAFPRLESVELYDPTAEKVVATGTIDQSKRTVELTVPFATGVDPTAAPAANTSALTGLQIRAKADNMSRVGCGVGAIKAVYNSGTVTPIGTSDTTLTICGWGAPVDGSTVTVLEDQLNAWLGNAAVVEAAGNAGWDVSLNSAKDGILFTAKVAGAIDAGNSAGGPPASIPFGLSDANEEIAGADADVDEHIFIQGTVVSTALNSGAVTVPTTGTTEAGTNNTFALTATNDNSTNNSSTYTVKITKKAANTEAKISSVKLVKKDTNTYNKDTVMYPATVSGTKIRVAALPYALEKEQKPTPNTTDMMQFSELKLTEASAGAKIVIDVNGTKTLMSVDEDNKGCSKNFIVGTGTTGWAGTTPVTVAVYSEKKWSEIVGSLSISSGTITAGLSNFDDATTKYQMSATYTPAEKGASLNSIKSTVDTNVKVEHDSNTVAITVPGSYVTKGTAFSLDIDVSKLATVHSGNATTAATLVKPDEGKATTRGRTLFKVTGSSPNYTLQYSVYNGSTYDAYTNFDPKLFVISEDENLRNSWNVKVNVNALETSADIDSITAAGASAVKDPADPYVWNLQISSTADKLQKMDINTTSKLAGVTVDGAPYNPDDYYDLGADMDITVTSEDGNNVVNYTLKITDDGAAANTDLAEVRAGAYNGTKGANNAWVIKVPEGTDMSNPSLTLSTVDSSAKVTSVNGVAYTAGMTVDLSEGKTLTIVVTAADGSKGTHTVTCQFGAVDLSEQYKDIPTNYATDWIKKAINAGIISNTGTDADGKLIFSPNAKTERMYFAMMVARADVMAKNTTITDKDAADKYIQSLYSGTPAFPDTTDLNSDINAALEYCKKAEIFKGDDKGNFNPKGIVNRIEVASILKNWLKLTEGGKENTHEFKDWANIPDWAKGNINAVADDKIMEGNANGTFGTGDLSRQDTAIIMMKAYERLKESK